ncbi:MAG TPA: AraC family transcriptional regulator [Algoriphagus sp.]|nr:AraC family transcriptional regulator [Algoriphagus sp.]
MNESKEKYNTQKIGIPPEYKDYFSHFYYAENNSSEIVTQTLLPSYQTILVFNFGEKAIIKLNNSAKISIEKFILLGPVKQAFEYSLPIHSQVLVVNFRKDAFYRLFGKAYGIARLPRNSNDLMFKDCFEPLWKSLNQLNNINERSHCILEFCKPHLIDRNKVAEKLANLDEKENSIESLANQLNQTKRNIQIHHKKLLGYTYKEFNRYQRFLKAIELIQNKIASTSQIDWFEILSECGYYDQSHFIRDFKHYLNISPSRYLKNGQNICVAKPD